MSDTEKLEISLKVSFDLLNKAHQEFLNIVTELELLYGYTTEEIIRICDGTPNP